MYIGIDFGACFSKISVFSGKNELPNFVPQCGSEGIPTKYMRVNGVDYYGPQCENEFAREKNDLILKEFKTRARMDIRGEDPTTGYVYRDVIHNYIQYLKNLIDDAVENNKTITNKRYDAITITAPAGRVSEKDTVSNYNRFLKSTVSEIFKIDEKKVFVREEPVAAALSWFYLDNDVGDKTILIFDLGGSTLDISVVERQGRNYITKAISGNSCGSNLWDRELEKLVVSQLGLRKDKFSPREKFYFDREVTNVKHRLSDKDDAKFSSLTDDGRRLNVKIKRVEDFEECTSDLLNRAIDLLNEIVNRLSSGPYTVDEVILVGGGSKMPQIRAGIIEKYPMWEDIIKVHKNVSTAVSVGAAFHSYLADSSNIDTEFRYVGVLAHSYGMKVRRVKDKEDMIQYKLLKEKEFSTGKIDATFDPVRPESDDQITMYFEIYESDVTERDCDSDYFIPLSKDSHLIVKYVKEIPSEFEGRATDYSVTPKIEIDMNNIVRLLINDAEVGRYELKSEGRI